MARSRTLKPEFWTDARIVKMTPYARLFYQGCWNFALCDQGHVEDDADSLKLKILPADDVDPHQLIDELMKHTRLVRKTTPDGRTYLHMATLPKHTRLETRWGSRCEYCAAEATQHHDEPPASTHNPAQPRASTREPAQPRTVKGKERKGREGKELTPPLTSFVGPPEPEPTHADDALIPKPKAAPKGTRLPNGFEVTPDMVAWARTNAPNVNGRRETERFCNYWWSKTGKDATKVKWELAWRNWMLKEQSDAERNGTRPPRDGPKPSTTDQRVNDALALGKKLQAQHDQQKAIAA